MRETGGKATAEASRVDTSQVYYGLKSPNYFVIRRVRLSKRKLIAINAVLGGLD